MSKLGDPSMHFWITIGMARTLGLNLSDAMLDGRLSQSTYIDLVARCSACPQAQMCMQWMGQQTSLAAAPPENCPNAAALGALKPAPARMTGTA